MTVGQKGLSDNFYARICESAPIEQAGLNLICWLIQYFSSFGTNTRYEIEIITSKIHLKKSNVDVKNKFQVVTDH